MCIESVDDKDANAARQRIADYLERWPHGVFQVVLHTHAVDSGELCDAVAEDGVTALYSPVNEICGYYLGDTVLHGLRRHPGRRGILILACGAAMGPGHIASVQSLVKECVVF